MPERIEVETRMLELFANTSSSAESLLIGRAAFSMSGAALSVFSDHGHLSPYGTARLVERLRADTAPH